MKILGFVAAIEHLDDVSSNPESGRVVKRIHGQTTVVHVSSRGIDAKPQIAVGRETHAAVLIAEHARVAVTTIAAKGVAHVIGIEGPGVSALRIDGTLKSGPVVATYVQGSAVIVVADPETAGSVVQIGNVVRPARPQECSGSGSTTRVGP